MSDLHQDIEGTRSTASDAAAVEADGSREPTPRDENHEATDGARFRSGQDSVEVNDSGVSASRAYGTEGATADEVDAGR